MTKQILWLDFKHPGDYAIDDTEFEGGTPYMRVKPCHMCEGTGKSEEYISGICGYCNSTGWVIA